MHDLPSLKEIGLRLDKLRTEERENKTEEASETAQSIFESYAYAKDKFARMEDNYLSVSNALQICDERAVKAEDTLKATVKAYLADQEVFKKFCEALLLTNKLRTINDLPDTLEKVATCFNVPKVAIVLERKIYPDFEKEIIPSYFLKGCMRYIDATLSDHENRIFIGSITKMMRPDIFFGDESMNPEMGGSCFSFGLKDKYNPQNLIGLLSFYDPDPKRFTPNLSTDYLEYFGNMIAATLSDLLTLKKS